MRPDDAKPRTLRARYPTYGSIWPPHGPHTRSAEVKKVAVGVEPTIRPAPARCLRCLPKLTMTELNRPGFGEVLYRRMKHAEAVPSRVPEACVAAAGRGSTTRAVRDGVGRDLRGGVSGGGEQRDAAQVAAPLRGRRRYPGRV